MERIISKYRVYLTQLVTIDFGLFVFIIYVYTITEHNICGLEISNKVWCRIWFHSTVQRTKSQNLSVRVNDSKNPQVIVLKRRK